MTHVWSGASVVRLMPTSESVELLAMVEEIATREIAPRAGDDEATATFPREVLRALGGLGILGLPFDEKISGIETKYLLRKSMKDLLPPEISGRRDKKGYPTPFARWLREDRMAFAREILDSPECRSRNILNPEGVEDRLRRHLAGEDFNWEIWRFITLELWMRIFMDRTLEAAPE